MLMLKALWEERVFIPQSMCRGTGQRDCYDMEEHSGKLSSHGFPEPLSVTPGRAKPEPLSALT